VSYVGRFAPSPTGPLHIGSLATAVASFLHARQSAGSWLVRIEDIDPPREVRGAADDILRTLEAYELFWDGPAIFQSARRAAYDDACAHLLSAGLAFRCSCTRSELRADGDGPAGPYPGTCRERTSHSQATAVRVRVADRCVVRFVDGLQGAIETELDNVTGDYVIWRRDGLPAYHLAVVVDDADKRVSTVVRGVDLLDSTAVHLHLQAALGLPSPAYVHLPVVVNAEGHKLSKQTGAVPISRSNPSATAATVLELLGARIPTELRGAPPHDLWAWAIENWRSEELRGRRTLALPPPRIEDRAAASD
jgi:glutamyl-Q tRNA(Asp) synthetase